jgi:Chaperone of endosialidase/Head domain of trimeric autotransporter adhesin/CUB domain
LIQPFSRHFRLSINQLSPLNKYYNMRKIYLFTLISLISLAKVKAQMGINKDGSAPHSSAMLDIKASATTNAKGLLMPRVADHTVIISPATGLMVFNTTTNTFWYFNGTAWTNMGSGGNNAWSINGTNVFTNNNVGINTSTPQTTLDVKGDGFLVSQKTKLTTEDPNLHVYNMPLSNASYADAAGILYDPSGSTAPYPSGNINTITTIYSYVSNVIGIKLTFEVFDTEANGDSIILLNNASQVLAKYSGNTLPPDFLYNGNYVQIKFKTNGNSTVGQGFKIKWQMVEKDGISNPVSGIIGNNTFFETNKGAFRSGNLGQYSNESIGNYSVAMGSSNRASGEHSFSMGNANNASGISSIAMGINSNATGYNSTAIGYYTNATSTHSFASGYQTKSGGYASTAMGNGTVSSNIGSFSSGYFSNSSGYASTALGYFTVASNVGSFASGYRALAAGYSANSLGYYSNASGGYSVALGGYTNANNDYSFASGYYTNANGIYSTAMGIFTSANSSGSTALGYSTNAYGFSSITMGYATNTSSNAPYGTASSTASFASGYQTISGGYASTSMGNNTNASGYSATALGNQTNASGYLSTAMGTGTTASGFATTAMGFNTFATGNNSTSMGSNSYASSEGSFVIGDSPNSSSTIYSQNSNSFTSRFRNGYYLFTSATLGTAAVLYGGSNSWSSISDSTKKENFQPIDGENVLKKIANMRTVTWNYKGQDPKSFRHYGPMAQEFFNAFGRDKLGVIGNDTTIASADFDGVNFTAIKALEKRTSELQTENENLKKRLALLEKSSSEVMVLKSEMEQLKALLLPEKEKIRVKIDSDK